jgi:glycogen debranching enzyme
MNFIEIENQYYILASSAFADQKTFVLKEGDTFSLFDRHGDIHQVGTGSQGIYHNGTRYLSQIELSINGHKPLLLSASPREDNQLLIVDLTNPDIRLDSEDIVQRGTIHIMRSKFLWRSVYHEKIHLRNFGLEPVTFQVELQFDADFSDIFEVRGTLREKKGVKHPIQKTDEQIIFSYLGLDDVLRKTTIALIPGPNSFKKNMAVYEIHLLPQKETDIEVHTTFSEGDGEVESLDFEEARNTMNMHMERTRQYCADILTSNEQFNDWIRRSRSDLITMTTQTPQGFYPYAGVPWYSTPFGRDGIITAMECLWVEPELAKGVLQYLAHTQAKNFNDFQDAEPGKIFHETRGGEMAALGETPFQLYYGTIDATPLFIILAGMYLERTNDLATIHKIWPNIEKALYWIDNHGDVDGDGFVEYKTKSSKGLTNQGWKDSFDSIFYEDGRLAEDPIALCEVQAYVYDARVKAADIARALGHDDIADNLILEAKELKEKFNEAFWSETKQIYVLALDGRKQPCNVMSSNAGHCLFSGIATPERARLTAINLLGDKMFSGWGIRTIATGEARYNPMSYHNGSIWPHDNALIAYGFSRYDLIQEAVQILSGTFDTALYTEGQRLPELFCGFERVKGQPPTSYPVACSPQAWSVGAVFLMIQAALGMRINAAKKTITFCHPVLPAFLKEITITNLRVNNQIIILQVRRSHEGVDVIMLTPQVDIEIVVYNKQVLETA